MLPTPIARQIQESIRAFLQQMFPTTTEYFRGMVERLVEDEGSGMFRGPWYELRLPFESVAEGEELPFQELHFPFKPHKHQAEAFRRLCGDSPRSTLVTTGTGSGKTECFMYPVLDYCARMQRQGQKGIKAVFLYPMNALATDQARRLAAAVARDEALKDVRVGMYVGGHGEEHITMDAEHVITSRNEMRKSPPDILLTNYKMLDYLLLRSDDRKLWQHNNRNGILRYLAVDELHSFDGAQATDLACLIRRLKHRVLPETGNLCCIGTSATIGGENSEAELCEYASKVFGETFGSDSIIRETMMNAEAFRNGATAGDEEPRCFDMVPGEENLAEMQVSGMRDPESWLRTQYRLWFAENADEDFKSERARRQLGRFLLGHRFTVELLNLYEEAGTCVLSETEVHRALIRLESSLAKREVFRAAMDSFLALCSHALYRHPASGRVQPFLRLHVQLWMRELSHMVARVLPWDRVDELKLDFRDTQSKDDVKQSLPLVFCRDCGTMTWGATVRRGQGNKLDTDFKTFVTCFFSRNQGGNLKLLHPVRDNARRQQDLFNSAVLCGNCMTLSSQQKMTDDGRHVCPGCHRADYTVPVDEYLPRRVIEGNRDLGIQCPVCGSPGMMIVGSRAASLNSAAISTLFASSCNDDKKLLAFSDNVQDASHRAGFFAGRTYSHTLRMAFHKALQGHEGENLAELYDQVGQLCCSRLAPKEQIRLFMPPDKEWLDDYGPFLRNGEIAPAHEGHQSLPELICKRLNWEFFSEMTWKAARGRTLERTGCMTLCLPKERIRQAAAALCNDCSEQLGCDVATEDLTKWVVAVLHKLRMTGGVAMPVLRPMYEGNRNNGLYALWDRPEYKPWLPRLTSTAIPRFFCNGPIAEMMPISNAPRARETWLANRTREMGLPGTRARANIPDFINRALFVLVQEDMLKHTHVRNTDVWGLNPEMLTLSCRVRTMQCTCCCGKIYTSPELEDLYTGMPCLKQNCSGRYTPVEEAWQGRRFYDAAHIVRIHASEHTGMLERDTREQTEKDFLGGDVPVPPNLLSCTPTLEMGIDIGDLSSVLLCSVPPAPANYRQRIGRAGRKDGNAFSLTTANTKPNDLYFFQDPADMVHGEVEAPGVYLDSPAILRRQIFAFALDEWVFQNEGASIPRKVDNLLRAAKNTDNAFPLDFLNYCKKKSGSLGDRFCELLELPPETKTDLHWYLTTEEKGGLDWNLAERIGALQHELDSYAVRNNNLREEQRRLQAVWERDDIAPAEKNSIEKQIDDLTSARTAMSALSRKLREKETLEFMTDEGLLPNYTFPEEGVTLKTVILKRHNNNHNNEPETHEYVRAAATAISDFAPGSIFYVQGRKVKIDQIDLATAQRETWRFCPQCSCAVNANIAENACPQCGTDWTDLVHQREVLKFNQVMAIVKDKDSRSLDDRDERAPMFYERNMSVIVEPQDVGDTYMLRLQGRCLTYTFLHHATFREFNFGKRGIGANEMQVNGRTLPVSGFRVCTGCGKLMEEDGDFAQPHKHDLHCPYRRNPAAARDNAMTNIFLYREIRSEALRIMLPGTGADNDEWRSSFEAALQLGIKAYFKGKVANLKYTYDDMVSPMPGNNMSRRPCLLIYDSVPGGTGNLKELTRNPETFVKVLQLALRHIVSCVCGNEVEKDGCHRCMYAFRGARDIKPSRRAAMAILRDLGISEADDAELPKPQKVEGAVAPEVNNMLLSSDLERLFVAWLRQQEDFVLEDHVVNGKTGYRLKAGNLTWEIEPQREELGGNQHRGGTVTDFTFHPLRRSKALPIVVYLDGYKYHADGENNRVSGDIKRREDLRMQQGCIVWTLTWADVMNDLARLNHVEPTYPQPDVPFDPERDLPNMEDYRADATLRQYVLTPIRILQRLLENGNAERDRWLPTAAILAACRLGDSVPAKPFRMQEARDAINFGLDDEVDIKGESNEPCRGYFIQNTPWRILWQLTQADGANLHNATALLSFDTDRADDIPEEEYQLMWRGFWCLYDFLQVLPHFRATTPALAQAGYRCVEAEPFPHQGGGLTDSELDGLEEEWRMLLRHQNFPAPELFYEVLDGNGKVMDGCIEVAWPKEKMGIVSNEYAEMAKPLAEQGWRIFVWGRQTPDELLEQLLINLKRHE